MALRWLPVRSVPIQMKLPNGTILDSREYLTGLGFTVRKSPKYPNYIVSGRDDVHELTTNRFRGIETVAGRRLILIVDEEEHLIHPIEWSIPS